MSSATTSEQRLDFDTHASGFSKAISHLDNAATKELDRVEFDELLRELVRIRVSQLNGCAYCVDMHTKDARRAGETDERLAALPVWRETPFFSERDRAALNLAEAIVLMSRDHVPQADYDAAAAVFEPDEVAALIAMVVTVNAWNAVGVSTRAWEPGSYQP